MRKNQTKISRLILNECIGLIRKRGGKITPLADNEYMTLSGEELRDYALQVYENVRYRHNSKISGF